MKTFIIVGIILVIVIAFILWRVKKNEDEEEEEEHEATVKKKPVQTNLPKGYKSEITFDEYNSKWDNYYGVRIEEPFSTTLSGVKYNDCQTVIKNFVSEDDQLMLLPDPENKHDKTATRVCTTDGWMVGWIPNQEWSDEIFHDLQKGRRWDAYVKEIRRPNKEWDFYNVIVELWRYEPGTTINI